VAPSHFPIEVGCNISSFQTYQIPQEKPDEFGEALVEILNEIVNGSENTKAKM
jgi:hypothetical protein